MIYYMMGQKMALMSSPAPTKYCQIFNLPAQYVPRAIALTKVFEEAIGPDLKFDLSKAEQAAKNANLAVDKVITSETNQNDGTVNQLFQSVTDNLKSQFGVALDATTVQQASQIFINAFNNRSNEHKDAWIFWSMDEGKGTGYLYRTLYASISSVGGQTVLSVTPLALSVSVDVVTKRVLCHTTTVTHYQAVAQGVIANEAITGEQAAVVVSALPSGEDDGSAYNDALAQFESAGYTLSVMLDAPK